MFRDCTYHGIEAIHDFKHNWETLPLVDIQTADYECPIGYENLITREWPGTEWGCNCKKSNIGKGFINFLDHNNSTDDLFYVGKCDEDKIDKGWVDVKPVGPLPLSQFYSKLICGLREGTDFFHSEFPKLNKTTYRCPLGYRPCGKGTIDKGILLHYSLVLCIREQERCPINHIELIRVGEPPKKGYRTVPLDYGVTKSLHF